MSFSVVSKHSQSFWTHVSFGLMREGLKRVELLV